MNKHIRGTLTDTHGRIHDYLRISLTEKCNLRCHYCMPAEGVPLSPTQITLDEIRRFSTLFSALGVSKVRLTGGEPLVRRDLPEIVETLSSDFSQIGVTTNGTLLTRKLPPLVDRGLSHVNISLDSLVPAKNEFITRRPNTTAPALKGLEQAVALGCVTKLNVVAMRNFNDDEFADFAALSQNLPVEIRFIEFMPFDKNDWKTGKFIPQDEIMAKIKERFPEVTPLENDKNSTSRAYQIPGFEGRIGFISSMSKHFCGGCNRLRMTADGHLKVCLFDNGEVNLKELLPTHSDEQLLEVVQSALNKKAYSHGGINSIIARENRPMVRIGG